MKVHSLLPLLLIAACAPAPRVRHPQLEMQVASTWSGGEAVEGRVDTLWWERLGDQKLKALVAQALEHNYDLRAAAARVEQAAAQAKIAGAPLWPQLSLEGSGSRTRRNFIGFPFGARPAPGAAGAGGAASRPGAQVLSSTTNSFSFNLAASWEVDLWGRLRAGQAAAVADWQAAQADLRGARLSLAAQTARGYFAALEARRQVELAEETLENFRLSSARIAARYERGLRPALDLRLARSTAAAAAAALAQRRRQLDGALRQLEILLGRYPRAAVELGAELPPVPAPAPAGLPAELVGRRPDLVAAERRLAAADARRLEARGALYPSISLTGSGGRSSNQLDDLLDGDFSVWSIVGNLLQPLFQGGRLRGGVKLAQAGAHQALATYAQSVLEAFAEVESALAAESFLARQEEALRRAAAQALAARRLAQERYARGLSDLITLLDAQRRAFDTESQWLAVRRQRLDTRIDLHLALGGGFEGGTRGGRSSPKVNPQ